MAGESARWPKEEHGASSHPMDEESQQITRLASRTGLVDPSRASLLKEVAER